MCDRCRWKKIKCDGARPCSNCRAANFPCESRARLSKQATPRSYVQYLEARVRQLEGQQENSWQKGPSSKDSPYAEETLRKIGSPANGQPSRSFHGLPDFLTLRELGTHVTDEDGFSRYMGPSSGVAFTAKVLEEVLQDDQPSDTDFYSLFNLDDLTRGRLLADADSMLWQVQPSQLPNRNEADRVGNQRRTPCQLRVLTKSFLYRLSTSSFSSLSEFSRSFTSLLSVALSTTYTTPIPCQMTTLSCWRNSISHYLLVTALIRKGAVKTATEIRYQPCRQPAVAI